MRSLRSQIRGDLFLFAEGLADFAGVEPTDEVIAVGTVLAEILLKWEKILDSKFDKKGEVTERRMVARG